MHDEVEQPAFWTVMTNALEIAIIVLVSIPIRHLTVTGF